MPATHEEALNTPPFTPSFSIHDPEGVPRVERQRELLPGQVKLRAPCPVPAPKLQAHRALRVVREHQTPEPQAFEELLLGPAVAGGDRGDGFLPQRVHRPHHPVRLLFRALLQLFELDVLLGFLPLVLRGEPLLEGAQLRLRLQILGGDPGPDLRSLRLVVDPAALRGGLTAERASPRRFAMSFSACCVRKNRRFRSFSCSAFARRSRSFSFSSSSSSRCLCAAASDSFWVLISIASFLILSRDSWIRASTVSTSVVFTWVISRPFWNPKGCPSFPRIASWMFMITLSMNSWKLQVATAPRTWDRAVSHITPTKSRIRKIRRASGSSSRTLR